MGMRNSEQFLQQFTDPYVFAILLQTMAVSRCQQPWLPSCCGRFWVRCPCQTRALPP